MVSSLNLDLDSASHIAPIAAVDGAAMLDDWLDLPAHILWGRCDPVAVAAIVRQLADEIPAAELTWLDDVGHYPMLEAPERWGRAVLDFLDRQRRNGQAGEAAS